ncbi:MAG TPA: hypothetical protein VNQ14_13470 [Woeseiaceae bacterium]|nr:hypothetical protein [Woeseiaceae bacterium]
MLKKILFCVTALALSAAATADEEAGEADQVDASAVEEVAVTDDGQPKTMSGMSILGNEEAPKALVIVPWKSSELGADMSLSDTLDDRARPVDREVFMRELSYYNLRSGE